MSKPVCLLLTLILLGGALVPPSLYAQDYLLFTAPMAASNGQVYRMDNEGNLTLRETFPVNGDPDTIRISPGGDMVVYDSYTSSPTLCTLFIKPDGHLRPPIFLSDGLYWIVPTVAFNPILPLFYTGLMSTINAYRYDYQSDSVEQVDAFPTNLVDGALFGYSPWAGRLIFYTVIRDAEETVIGGKLGSVSLNADGSFGSAGPLLDLPTAVLNGDLAVSPDGRWAALITTRHPSFMLVRIGADGTMSLADTVDYDQSSPGNLCFSPDSQHIYMLDPPSYIRTNDGDIQLTPAVLAHYRLEPQTGKLSEVARLPIDENGYYGGIGVGLAISPDGQFLAFRSDRLAPQGHCWIQLVRILADGSFEYLKDKRVDVDHYINDLAFTWLPHNAAGPQWTLYR